MATYQPKSQIRDPASSAMALPTVNNIPRNFL